MAFPEWTNVPSKFEGKTISTVTGTTRKTIVLNFTDGTQVHIHASLESKDLGDYTTRTAPELLIN